MQVEQPPARPPLVLPFADIPADGLALAGGKAVNLGVLTRAGLPVPPGVCVTTEAYRRVAARAGLDGVLAALAGAAPDELPALALRARELMLAAPVPEDVAEDIARAVRSLAAAGSPVAVRSSATAEDLPHASFAGQQDTFLNVVGPDAVHDAVRRCWASLWTDRAVAYRAANGVDHHGVRLAVAIQSMVDSAVAGVMFTADPVTGRRGQTVIDASPGLGEAVVSGAVNPDHFVVDPDGRIVERRLGDKLLTISPLPGGGTESVRQSPRPPGADEEPCLTDEQITALARLGAAVEDHYGSPQDTEWAIDGGGTLWLTQARPVTTLYPVPVSASASLPAFPGGPPGGLRVYMSVNVAQGVLRPFTPMGLNAFRLITASAGGLFGVDVPDRSAGAPVIAVAAERIFVDVTGVLRSPFGRRVLPRVLDVMEARSAVVLRGLLDRPELSAVARPRLPLLRRIVRALAHFRVPLRVAEALADPRAARARADRVVTGLVDRVRVPDGATDAQRLDRAEDVLGGLAPVVPSILPAAVAGFAMMGLAGKVLGARVRPGELQAVLRGVPHNVTTEMDLALWHLAERVRRDPAAARLLLDTPAAELAAARDRLPAVVSEGLAEFLAVYGARAVAEIDLGMPRWSDDPTQVLGTLANYLRLDDPAMAPDALFGRGAREAEAMITELAGRLGPLRGGFVRFALGRTRQLAGIRELPKFALVSTLGAIREHLDPIGAKLAGRGLLSSAQDVYFLTFAEVRAAVSSPEDLRALVARRREVYDRELRRRRIPRVLLSDGTEPEALATGGAADGALTGTPASAGVVTGVARVILDPVGARLEPGEILVAPSTDPGWTPLFLTAGGLVMEMGGANSHGAVVAREYGIPAVVGVHRATELIAGGAEVTLDGSTGTITLA